METPKNYVNTNTVNGVTGTTEVTLKAPHPDTPDDLNINLSIRPTGDRSFRTEIHIQGMTTPEEMVAFFQQLSHQLGHEILEDCVNMRIVQGAIEQAAMESMVDDAIERILGTDGD